MMGGGFALHPLCFAEPELYKQLCRSRKILQPAGFYG